MRRASKSFSSLLLASAAGLAVSVASQAQGQIESTWTTATSADWFTPASWSTNPEVPYNDAANGRFYRALFPTTGTTYTVTLSQPITLSSMLVSSSAARVGIGAGGDLQTVGGISITAGRVNMAGGTLRGNVTTSGTGRIALTSNPASVMDGVRITGTWSASDATGTTRVRNGLTVSGVLNMNGSGSSLVFEGSQILSSPTILTAGSTLAPIRLDIEGNSVLTFPSGSISGFATIGDQRYATGSNGFVNNGTISATNPNAPMRFKCASLVNNGVLSVINGARMVIERPSGFVNNGQVNMTGGRLQFVSPNIILPTFGTLNADSASTTELIGTMSNQTLASNTSPIGWTFSGASILNSTLTGAGGIPFRFGSDTTFRPSGKTLLSNVTLQNVEFQGGGIEIAGALTVDGTAHFNNQGTVTLSNDVHLQGGVLRVTDTPMDGAVTLTIDPDATLIAAGPVVNVQDVQIVNEGQFRIESGRLSASGAVFDNRGGDIELAANATLEIYGDTFQNTGTITQRTGSTLSFRTTSAPTGMGNITREPGTQLWIYRDIDLNGTTVSLSDSAPINVNSGGFFNGTVVVNGDSALRYSGGRLGGCTIVGTFRPYTVDLAPSFTLSGPTSIVGELIFPGAASRVYTYPGLTLQSGTLRLDGGYTLINSPDPVVIGANAVIAGRGGVEPAQGSEATGTLTNSGTISADQAGSTLNIYPPSFVNNGVLEVLQDATLRVGARTQALLGGTVRIREGTFRMLSGTVLQPVLAWDRQGGVVEIGGNVDLNGTVQILDADRGSWHLRDDGILSNGTIELSEDTTLTLGSSGSWADVAFRNFHLVGDLFVPSLVGVTAIDSLRIDGDVTVQDAVISFIPTSPSTVASLDNAHVHLNTGAIGIYNNSRLILGPETQVGANAQFDLDEATDSIGRGNIAGTIENRGRIYCDTPGTAVHINIGSFINHGVVEAINGGNATIVNNVNTWSNADGVLRAGPGSQITTGGTVLTSNLGTIETAAGRWSLAWADIINTGSTLHLGQTTTGPLHVLKDSTILGGTIDAPGWTGIVVLQEVLRLDNVTVNTDILLTPSTSIKPLGTLIVNGRVTMNPACSIRGAISGNQVNLAAGEYLLNGSETQQITVGGIGFQDPSTLTIGPLAHLRGGWAKFFCGTLQTTIHQGTITAEVPNAPITIFTSNFDNQGTLAAVNGGSFIFQNAPGFGPNPANLTVSGTLRASSDSSVSATGWIRCSPNSTLDFTLGAPVPNQVIASAGTDVQLNGTLRVALQPNYLPTAGDSWRLFEGAPIVGQFTTLDLAPLPPSFAWNTSQLGVGIISIDSTCAWTADGCYADFNNDGVIDGDDVIGFFAEWDNGLPCADADLSTSVDGDDVILFFASWDQNGGGDPRCE
jgi:hypothetical protein